MTVIELRIGELGIGVVYLSYFLLRAKIIPPYKVDTILVIILTLSPKLPFPERGVLLDNTHGHLYGHFLRRVKSIPWFIQQRSNLWPNDALLSQGQCGGYAGPQNSHPDLDSHTIYSALTIVTPSRAT
jgi:hypothetical protein